MYKREATNVNLHKYQESKENDEVEGISNTELNTSTGELIEEEILGNENERKNKGNRGGEEKGINEDERKYFLTENEHVKNIK